MEVGEAFVFLDGKGGEETVAMESIALANRFRTRARPLRLLSIGVQDIDFGVSVSIIDTNGHTLARIDATSPWTPVSGIVLAGETTFYLVAHLRPGDRFLQGTEFASPQPELVDLGTWVGYPAWNPAAWRPSAGARAYPANFRFEICPGRRNCSRAVEILELASQGYTDKAIAVQLGIGESTVETHWKALRERTGCSSRTEAVASHLRTLAERAREDLEAQRDRVIAESWLREHRPHNTTLRGIASMRSWPGWPN